MNGAATNVSRLQAAVYQHDTSMALRRRLLKSGAACGTISSCLNTHQTMPSPRPPHRPGRVRQTLQSMRVSGGAGGHLQSTLSADGGKTSTKRSYKDGHRGWTAAQDAIRRLAAYCVIAASPGHTNVPELHELKPSPLRGERCAAGTVQGGDRVSRQLPAGTRSGERRA